MSESPKPQKEPEKPTRDIPDNPSGDPFEDAAARIGDLKDKIPGLGGVLDMVQGVLDAAESFKERAGGQSGGATERNVQFGFNIRTMAGGPPSSMRAAAASAPKKEHVGHAEVEDERQPQVDVFDEDDHVLLVVELPGVEPSDVSLSLNDDILTLTAKAADRSYRQEVLVPGAVDFDRRTTRMRNGILEIVLPKPR